MIEKWMTAWRARGARAAFVCDASVATYGQLADATGNATRALEAAGIGAGDVVAFAAEFSSASAALLFALAKAGAVALPLAPELSSDAAAARCAIARVTWRARPVAEDAWAFSRMTDRADPHELVRALAQRRRPGLVLFSSGSTGEPKGMLHDLAAFLARFVVRERDPRRVLPLMLADHVGGLDMLLRALAAGDRVLVPTDRSAVAITRAVVTHRAEVIAASPTMLNLLHAAGAFDGDAFTSVQLIAHGAEPMPPAVLRKLREALPHAQFQQKFGTSETAAVRVRDRGDGSGFFRIDDPGATWRVAEDELWLRTSSRVVGYLNASSEGRLLDDGWFRTGDRVEQTPDGWLRIRGRIRDVINVGGEKVTPMAVEHVLLEMPEVADCAVRGEASALSGQVPVADVVWRGEIGAVEALRAVRAFCRGRLAPHEIPVKVHVRPPDLSGATLKKRRSTV